MAVVNELMIVKDDDVDAAGATVWWRLSGTVLRETLVEQLEARGIAHRPKTIEAETALRRAVSVLKGKRRLLRPLRRGAWAIVEESLVLGADELKHWTGPTVSMDKIGRCVVRNATQAESEAVTAAYDRFFDELTTEDIASWLIDNVHRLGAVGLRDGGGIYYLPPDRLPEWRSLVDALSAASPAYKVYMVPTVRMTADGMRAILDSLTAEVMIDVEKVSDELALGDLGPKALDKRAADAGQLLAKVSRYEALLGTKLDELRKDVSELETAVVAAKLAAEAAREEAGS